MKRNPLRPEGPTNSRGRLAREFDVDGDCAMSDRPSPPRLGLTVEEAAKAVGISESSFKRHVQPELRIVRRGSLRIIPVPEIERWLEGNATLAASTRMASRMAQTTKRPRTVEAAGGMAQGDVAP
jgi:hypothetical protein